MLIHKEIYLVIVCEGALQFTCCDTYNEKYNEKNVAKLSYETYHYRSIQCYHEDFAVRVELRKHELMR